MTEAAGEPLLSITRVTVERGDARLLDDVNLVIQPGQHTAILGRNGSGKSTLVKLITRQIFPTRGEPVRVFGRDAWNVSELRTRLGVVSSSVQLDMTRDEHLGVFETALSGFFASTGVFAHHGVTEEMKDRAEQALVQMGVMHLADRRLGTLSTGESRRVLIARALVHHPEALLLDEPCAGLDPTTRHHFLDSLRTLAQQGVTLLLVTHHVEEILPEIGHVVMMSHGRVAHQGAKAGLLTGAVLSRIFEMPTTVSEETGWYAMHLDR